MSELSGKTALVADSGLFLPVAFRLADAFHRVLYWTPWETGFPRIHSCVLGDGFNNIERCDDIWKVKDEVDLFVFPDIHNSGIQLELERQGKRVWGSRAGDSYEINRRKFLKALSQNGLSVPSFETVFGLTKLREYLVDKEDKYIKISKYRGSFETCHWRSWKEDHCNLDAWGVEFGACQDLIKFLVFDPIGNDVEIGADLYCVDGEYPPLMLRGDEHKDKSYIAAVTSMDDMPQQVIEVLEAFSTTFLRERYRNQLSLELRGEGKNWYCIDLTCRGGLPSTASQLALWKNFPEIVWAGANGELVQPEPAAEFTAEVELTLCGEKSGWRKCVVPEELAEVMRLQRCCFIDGAHCFPPDECFEDHVGWLQAQSDSIENTVKLLGEYASKLPDGITAKTETLVDLLKELHHSAEEGVPVADNIPEPEVAIEEP